MGSTGVAATFAFCGGLAGAVQIAVQGKLGERVGSIEAMAWAAASGGVLALALLLVARRSLGPIGAAAEAPKWQLLGGLMGVLVVLAITVSGPRIGLVATTGMLIAGQFALATIIDRFGWLGVERVALTWPRVLGLTLLAAGAALTLRR